MDGIQTLTILYDLALTTGGEVHARQLLDKTLQRLVYHTAMPYALFLEHSAYDKQACAEKRCRVEARIAAVIGLHTLQNRVGEALAQPCGILQGDSVLVSDPDLPDLLPPGMVVKTMLRLRVGQAGTIFLFSPREMTLNPSIGQILEPVMRNLEKNLFLCRANDAYTEQLETERREKLRLIAKVYECSRDGILLTDAQSCIVDLNPAASEITGYSREEIIGNTPRLWRSDHHEPEFYRQMWHALLETGGWRGEIWNRRKSGEVYPALLSIDAIRNEAGEVQNYVSVFSDISSLKQSQARLEYLAHHDALTDLPNRTLFNDRLGHALSRSLRSRRVLAVVLLDLDHFKNVNDSLGHAAGDRILREAADRLRSVLRKEDTLARFGGDEFAVLLEDIEIDMVATTAERIRAVIAQPFLVDLRTFFLGVSIGISLFPNDGETVASLISNADAAMYQAKAQGRNAYAFYTPLLTENAMQRVQTEADLHAALERCELSVYYQPLVDLTSGEVIGAEALLRWIHPQKGFIPPDRFIPLAEETNLIVPIGAFVLEQACTQSMAWQVEGISLKLIAVNISGRQLSQPDFRDTVRQTLQRSGLPPEKLELEVTESLFLQDAYGAIEKLDAFRNDGIRVAVDDFGTGYSGLSQLKRLPINKLKIDRSFVQNLPNDKDDIAISRMVIALGGSLGLSVLAEGVETEAQRDFLLREGVTLAQGYLFGKPMPAADFADFVRNKQSLAK